jgi:hypothetical protein
MSGRKTETGTGAGLHHAIWYLQGASRSGHFIPDKRFFRTRWIMSRVAPETVPETLTVKKYVGCNNTGNRTQTIEPQSSQLITKNIS